MNRTTTIVLVVILAALGLYVLLVQLPKDKAAAQVTPTQAGGPVSFVWQATADQVTGIRLEDRVKNRSLALTKDAQGVWSVSEPELKPANSTAITGVLSSLTALSVNTTITSTTDLSAFGVLSPTYTLELSLSDGKQLKAAIGDKTPTGSGYYLLREGETNALVVATYGLDGVIGMLDAPPYAPTPTPPVSETPEGTPMGSPEPAATGTPPASGTAPPSTTP